MIRCAQFSCMDGIRARDQNREILGGSHPTPSLQISSIPLLNKSGRWGFIRCRGKGTRLTARGPYSKPSARPFMCMASLDVTEELVMIIYLHFREEREGEKKTNKVQEVDDTCPSYPDGKWQSWDLRFKPGLCDSLAAHQEQEFL